MNSLDIDARYPIKGKTYQQLLEDAEQLLKLHKVEAALERIIAAGRMIKDA